MKTITIACKGNIARSPVAALLLMRALQNLGVGHQFVVISRGIQGTTVMPKPVQHPNMLGYPELYRDAAPVLRELGVTEAMIKNHQSKPIDQETVNNSHLVLAMDAMVLIAIKQLFPGVESKLRLFSSLIGETEGIVDPEGVAGAEKQRIIFMRIAEIVQAGANSLVEE